MSEFIKDGRGKGYLAHVDEENNLHVSANIESEIAHRSLYDGSAFCISGLCREMDRLADQRIRLRKASAEPSIALFSKSCEKRRLKRVDPHSRGTGTERWEACVLD